MADLLYTLDYANNDLAHRSPELGLLRPPPNVNPFLNSANIQDTEVTSQREANGPMQRDDIQKEAAGPPLNVKQVLKAMKKQKQILGCGQGTTFGIITGKQRLVQANFGILWSDVQLTSLQRSRDMYRHASRSPLLVVIEELI
ncbi:hypothetical protein RF11_05138 [Thelohanellus kitauei]|uniref:Uncharacterized protein n=1 Tax=Thelohanellus kitauei TaxID=669202 RepID=A0A0C2IZ63_THEKT|nr:hypothetical protein RF11_05138 [Thelohanellus kitauei]